NLGSQIVAEPAWDADCTRRYAAPLPGSWVVTSVGRADLYFLRQFPRIGTEYLRMILPHMRYRPVPWLQRRCRRARLSSALMSRESAGPRGSVWSAPYGAGPCADPWGDP